MDSPAFGQADLSNCERELIHLAGSVQPHGALLLLQEPGLEILQASANCLSVLGRSALSLLEQPLAVLDERLAAEVRSACPGVGSEPLPLQCSLRAGADQTGALRAFEAALHRPPGGGLVLELEPVPAPDERSVPPGTPTLELATATLQAHIAAAVQRYTAAATVNVLADSIVKTVRELTGYDRVMVYRFDPDGHGKIIAEARDPRLESLLGHHYPATDIPQRARELYLKNRVRMLVDVDYPPQPLLPELRPDTGEPLDMSMCQLRSMSPLHLQYLRNMGVTGTLVASLVREGALWGLIACHHYRPRHLGLALRSAVDLLAEVASTRIAAIENYAHAQVALLVRRLEQRLIEATSTEGDWRQALFRHPRTLLQPLEASGAALFQGDEILTAGEVPSTPELRTLRSWVDAQPPEPDAQAPLACSAVGKANPALASLTPTASGVLAVKLSATRPDYLMWFRKEQLLTVTWAGDPYKPIIGNDPLQLSPRRSFEAWSEIVRGTALPWTHAERMMARAIGIALVDIIVQVHAVRLLIAEHQLGQIRATVAASREPVLLASPQGALVFANPALLSLRGGALAAPEPGAPVSGLFLDADRVQRVLASLYAQPWRGEWVLATGSPEGLPVAVRAESVTARDGSQLGHIVVLDDLRQTRLTAQARRRLEDALAEAGLALRHSNRPTDAVLGAILTNASLAAMDIADAAGNPGVAPLLQELQASAQRAAALYARLQRFSS